MPITDRLRLTRNEFSVVCAPNANASVGIADGNRFAVGRLANADDGHFLVGQTVHQVAAFRRKDVDRLESARKNALSSSAAKKRTSEKLARNRQGLKGPRRPSWGPRHARQRQRESKKRGERKKTDRSLFRETASNDRPHLRRVSHPHGCVRRPKLPLKAPRQEKTLFT